MDTTKIVDSLQRWLRAEEKDGPTREGGRAVEDASKAPEETTHELTKRITDDPAT
jgi:hypothetical protein